MKTLLIASILTLASLNAFADSESQLKACISKTYSAALKAPQSAKSSEVLKFVAKDIKACKDEVRSIAKNEKSVKRKAKLADQIKKLQAKLTSK